MIRKEILKLNHFWRLYEIDGNLIIMPEKEPICSAIYGDEPCYGILLIHDFSCYYHPQKNICHCDVKLRCSKCGRYYINPVALPKELLDRIRKSKYHGKILREELKEIYGNNLPKEVEDRLKSWAYY